MSNIISPPHSTFSNIPSTGVIYVSQQAYERGYTSANPEWANLGQGAPETGQLEGGNPRIKSLNLELEHHEYAAVNGLPKLRQKIAELYNFLYRQDKKSQYTWRNVSVSGGGRIALARIAATLDKINFGHLMPDYTAYEELLNTFKTFVPISILLNASCGYEFSASRLEDEIIGKGLKALLMSNPCNPTGKLIEGEKLNHMIVIMKRLQCSFIVDEFYSHYIYTPDIQAPKIVSAARYIKDVNEDSVIIVDGVTKNWRYPGWRVSWTLAPETVIDTIANVGSFMDGGASHPMQSATIGLLEPEFVLKEAKALQQCFTAKRNMMIHKLRELNFIIDHEPEGGFFIWANLANMPAELRDGFAFFYACLDEKVIVVPGSFFDINPGKRRPVGRLNQYVRISFGPNINQLNIGIAGIKRVIGKYV